MNFTDTARAHQRTLFGLYNTVTLGVTDTAMASYGRLPEHVRWSLAFYVNGFALPAEQVAAGKQAWADGDGPAALTDVREVTTLTPAQAQADHGDRGAALLSYLSSRPDLLFSGRPAPLEFSRTRLAESLAAYRAGDRNGAYELAVTAYLEGFELAEAGLNAVDPELRETIEHAMGDYRNAVRNGVPVDALASRAERITGLLAEAQERLDSRNLSGGAAFSGSLIILLREGLEALLVVVALGAFLVKTGRRDALPYLHAGWIGALAAGVATWWVSTSLVEISGAGRELTEGVAAVVAAGVLFYVGFWLHNKTHADQWKRFIEGSVQKALSTSTLWSLAGLSFITVYREVFETILFYQALWVQTVADGRQMVVAGLGVAAALLAVLAWVIIRFSTRLPLRQFFGVTGWFMVLLAVIFAGKGIAALQEAGVLPANPLDLPSFGLLGIYPNLEAIGTQLALVAMAVALTLASRRQNRRMAVRP